jgi:hypothetical protein
VLERLGECPGVAILAAMIEHAKTPAPIGGNVEHPHNCPARALRPRSSASLVSVGTSPDDKMSTRHVFGSRKEPSRAARALPDPLASP